MIVDAAAIPNVLVGIEDDHLGRARDFPEPRAHSPSKSLTKELNIELHRLGCGRNRCHPGTS